MPDTFPLTRRTIRSFVLRQGRMTPAQQRAITDLGPRFCILFQPTLLNIPTLFGNDAPTVLEIGFGMGETTARIASENTDKNFIALEVHSPGVGSLLQKIELNALTNLRIIQHDAVEVLDAMIAPASLAGVHVFFPDPWHKKKHHKRRLLQAPLIHALAERLAPGGYLHIATDWAEYADEILATLRNEPLLANTVADFAPRPAARPLTKFEARGLKLGHEVFDLLFSKTP